MSPDSREPLKTMELQPLKTMEWPPRWAQACSIACLLAELKDRHRARARLGVEL